VERGFGAHLAPIAHRINQVAVMKKARLSVNGRKRTSVIVVCNFRIFKVGCGLDFFAGFQPAFLGLNLSSRPPASGKVAGLFLKLEQLQRGF
jgi:hypothetical protein